MSFALSMRSVPTVTSYEEAVAFYERCIPWRNGGDDRPLVGKRKRDTGVRMDGDAVVFRYSRTNVIRWNKDGSYTFDNGGYSSRSTSEFANTFMPRGHMLFGEARHLRIKDRVYAVWGRGLSVSAEGVVSGPGLGRFTHRTVNRKRARGLLKEVGYYEYLAWHKLMYPMVQDTMPPRWKRPYIDFSERLAALAQGQEAYHKLMMAIDGEPDSIRETLYMTRGDAHRIWDVTYHDWVPDTVNLRRYDIVMREA